MNITFYYFLLSLLSHVRIQNVLSESSNSNFVYVFDEQRGSIQLTLKVGRSWLNIEYWLCFQGIQTSIAKTYSLLIFKKRRVQGLCPHLWISACCMETRSAYGA